MKSRILVFLLLCMLLSACAAPPELEKTPYTLPVLLEQTALVEEDPLPVLNSRSAAQSMVSGPGGSVNALQYRNGKCMDPVYGDVDGDGLTELVYRTAGAEDGTIREAIWVYGTERGLPIQKGSCLFRIGAAKTALVQSGDQVYYSYTNSSNGLETTSLLRLSLENDRLTVEGKLPEGLALEYDRITECGASFQKLKSRTGGRLLAVDQGYFLWREPGTFFTAEELTQSGVKSFTCAAVTNDSVTVTGLVYWYTELDGTNFCASAGTANPIRVNETGLDGMAKQIVLDKLGEPCLELQSEQFGHLLHWFTEDGKLLTVYFENGYAVVSLTELPIH